MKTKFKSKFLSILLVLVMVLSIVPFGSLTAFAEQRAERDILTVESGNSLNMSIDSNGILDWDNVTGATGYTVTLTKPNFAHLNSWDTTNSAFALISSIDQLKYDSSQYTIVVSAKGVSASESMGYYYTSNVDQLESPNGLYWDGDTANWSAVDGASIYYVELYNFDGRVTLLSTNSTSLDFSGFSPEDGWTFRVQARQSNSGTLSAKRDSLFIESPAKGTRTRPINALNSGNALNMNIGTDGILRWDEVSGATGYTISITQPNITNLYNWNSDNEAFALISSIDQLKYNSGQYTIVVSAKGVSASESMGYYYTSNVDQLESPNGLYWDGDTANWSAVDGASIYYVELYNFDGRVTLLSTNSTSLDFSGFSPEDGWTFRVQARQSNSGTLSAKRDSLFIESPAKDGSSVATSYHIGADVYNITTNEQYTGGKVKIVTPDDTGDYAYVGYGYDVDANAEVTMYAQADTGYEFVEWRTGSKSGTQYSTNATVTFNATEDKVLYAIFQQTTSYHVGADVYNITTNEQYTGGKVKIVTPDDTGDYAYVGYGYDVDANAEVTMYAQADTGYEFVEWRTGSVSGTQYSTNATVTFNATENKVLYAIFQQTVSLTTYTVTFDANGGSGTMLDETGVSGEYTLPANGFTAPDGKQFKGWATSANGSVIEGTTYNVTANVEFFAIWEDIPVNNFTITATAGANGSISPSGEVTVAEGEDKTFTITANSGYHIKDVKVNGSSVGAVATYTFNDVAANATITVEFEVDTVPHVCNPSLVPEDEPDCLTAGKSAYYHCECGKNYEDAQGNTEIDNLETWGILNALGHDPSTTWSTDGEYHWKECTRCAGQQLEKAAHADTDNNGKCDTCEYQMSTTPDNSDNPNNTPDNPNNTHDDPTDDKDGLGAGAIVGIVIGSLVVLGGGGFALYWFVLRKKPILPTDPTTPVEEAPDTDVDADTDEDAEATDKDDSPETDDEAPDTEDAP